MTPEEQTELDKLPRWGLEEKPMEEVTVQELEELCDSAFKRDQAIDALMEQVNEQTEAKNAILERVRKYIVHFGKDKYESAVGTIELRSRLSFKTPKSLDEKRDFFEWLTDKGVFYEYASVNSNSLNSLCKQEVEIAKEEGRECKIPGIGDPSEFQTIHLRRKK